MIGRIWFPQAPGTVSLDQRAQIGVGLIIQGSTPPPPPFSLLDYMRRYLNDVEPI